MLPSGRWALTLLFDPTFGGTPEDLTVRERRKTPFHPYPVRTSPERDGLFSVTLSVILPFYRENTLLLGGTLLCGVRTFLPAGGGAIARHTVVVFLL